MIRRMLGRWLSPQPASASAASTSRSERLNKMPRIIASPPGPVKRPAPPAAPRRHADRRPESPESPGGGEMDDRSARARRALERFGAPSLFVLASFVVYGRSLAYPFVLDDRMAIVDNDFLKSARNPLAFLVSDYSRGTTHGPGYFRPLMMISFWLQGSLLGWSPGPFHAVNIVRLGRAAGALFLAARSIGASPAGAFFGGSLFLAFPPAQEPVGSIVGRCDLLAALLFLLGWRSQIAWETGAGSAGAPPRTARTVVSLFCLGLGAMLGKESAAIFPVVVALTPVALPAPQWRPRLRGRIAIGAAAALALAVYLALRGVATGGMALAPEALAGSQNPVGRLPPP